jgi:hypothetical protein
VEPQALEVRLVLKNEALAQTDDPSIDDAAPYQIPTTTITLAWTCPSFAAVKGIVHAPSSKPSMKPESRDALLTAIVKARGWIDDVWLGESPPSTRLPKMKPRANGTSACWHPSPSFRPASSQRSLMAPPTGPHGHRSRQSAAIFVGRAGAEHRTPATRIFRGHGVNANAAVALSEAAQTGHCLTSNRSPARRNGNWKWRAETGAAKSSIQDRDSKNQRLGRDSLTHWNHGDSHTPESTMQRPNWLAALTGFEPGNALFARGWGASEKMKVGKKSSAAPVRLS